MPSTAAEYRAHLVELAPAGVVVAGRRDPQTGRDDPKDPTPPCGACRQFLYEFNPDMTVVSEGLDGERKEWRLSELLKDGFGPDDLAGRSPA